MKDSLPHNEAITKIALNIFRLNGILTDWGNNFSSVFGLTTPRWQILGAIQLAGTPLTIPQIAHEMGITRQGVLKQINGLVEEGLLVAKPNPLHKRAALYEITDTGRHAFNKIDSQWGVYSEEIAKAFKENELELAVKVLTKLGDNFKQ